MPSLNATEHWPRSVARHSVQGWDNPALPDDVEEIGHLLQLGTDPTLRLLREIDAD